MLFKPVLVSILILLGIFSTYNVQAVPSVKIVDTYGYLDESGQYVVVGEVVNNGDMPVHFVGLTVTFFDKNRGQIEQLSVSSSLEVIRPGQTSPFVARVLDTKDASFVSSYDVKIGNVAPTTYKEEKLSIIFHKLQTEGNMFVISGRIANDGSSTSSNTKAIIVLYNTVGEPVRYATTFTEPRNILPFGSSLFSIKIQVDNPANISGYAISSESSNYAETKRLVQIQEITMHRVREVADISNLLTLDKDNRIVGSVNVGDPVLVKLNITNTLTENRDYTYILQVKDQDRFVVSLGWSMGTLPSNNSTAAVIAWVPDAPGIYTLEVFVWKSIEEPTPLAFRTLATNLQVS